MSDELTPITRKETFLAKAGGQNVVTPTPITREETFLQAIIDNGGGGGGGSDLPAVTSEDAGKVLTVSEEGEWVAGGGGGTGGGVLVVGVEMGETTMTLDKTWKEIYDAPLALIPVVVGNETTWMYRASATYETGDYFVSFAQFTEDGTVAVAPFYTNTEDGYPVMQMGG